MVVDAYTLRVLRHHGYQRSQSNYAAAKAYCQRNLPRSLDGYQEFHALMVEHAKRLRAAGFAASRKLVAD
jgi:endonuclease-3 related protein